MAAAKKPSNGGEYYVYKLINPINLSVFYIGKGKGDRVSQHLKHFKRGKLSNIKKNNVIKEIINIGLNPIEVIDSYFDDEQAALDYEEFLISKYGIDNLTNIMRKGNASTNPLNDAEQTAYKIINTALFDINNSKNKLIISLAKSYLESGYLILDYVSKFRSVKC